MNSGTFQLAFSVHLEQFGIQVVQTASMDFVDIFPTVKRFGNDPGCQQATCQMWHHTVVGLRVSVEVGLLHVLVGYKRKAKLVKQDW